MKNKNVNYAEKTEKFAQMGKDVLDKIIKELDEQNKSNQQKNQGK